MTQHERRHNPYPWTWEIPTMVIAMLLLVLAGGAQLGRALANWLAGGGWRVPARADLFSSLPGLIIGDARAGLPGPAGPAGPAATATVLWLCMIITDVLLLAALIWGLRLGLGRWGPGRMRGMASPAEAERLLGVSRLRKNAAIIRPDLHTRKGAQS